MGTNTEMLVKSIVDLPTLPQVITTLMTMLDDPETSVRDINNIMGKDQTLVAKMLKLVNSAFYAIPKRVTSVSQAISILGFKTVKSIVLSASIIGMTATTRTSTTRSSGRILWVWARSAATSSSASRTIRFPAAAACTRTPAL